jgi:uroporphyrinogen III methyltransferase/synthase
LSALRGKRVLVTRSEGQASLAAELLRAKGAEPIVVPTIAIGPPDEPRLADDAIKKLGAYDWIAFTSANGVERTWELVVGSGGDAKSFGAAKLAAVGPATASALASHGLVAHITARETRGEGLAASMLEVMGKAGSVLLLRAQIARDALPDALRAAGHAVDIVAVYKTSAPPGLGERLTALFDASAIDAILFTSGSTVSHVKDALGPLAHELLARVRVASIGPVTTEAATQHGIRVDVEATPHSMAGLVEALEASFARPA